MNRLTHNLALLLCTVYLAFGLVWNVLANIRLAAAWPMWAGGLFVLLTTPLVYLFVARARATRLKRDDVVQSLALYRHLTENVQNYAIVFVDTGGAIASWNEGAERLTGYSAAEAIGRQVSSVYADHESAEKDMEIERALLAQACAQGNAERECLRVRKDGSTFWAHTTITPIFDPAGSHIGFSRIMCDVSESHAAVVKLRRAVRSYAVLSDVNQAIIRIREPLALFAEACQIAVAQGGFRMAWIGLLDEQSRHVVPVASAGVVADYLQQLHIVLDDSPRGRGPTASALRDGRHVVIQDIATDQRMGAWRQRAMQLGYGSVAAFPLILKGEVRGVVNLYAAEPNFFDETEVHLFDEMASDIAFALSYTEQETQRQQAEAERERLLVQLEEQARQELVTQQQLQRQERLAAIGQLAAGIAHDFNNIMSVIVVHAQVGMMEAETTESDHHRYGVIEQQARRASQIIRQLLDFGRRSAIDRQPLDLLPLLKEQVKLLECTLGEDIELELVHDAGVFLVKADPTRIQQVLINLAVNARDAMPAGGKLRFDLTHVRFGSQQETPLTRMAAGPWVRLSIGDTGTGIAAEVLDHIFEPFFTTKDVGKGTGLGLPQVHGIVSQHEGYIAVESAAGVGTTFTIYLPALAAVTADSAGDLILGNLPRGQGQTILVVEDNAGLRATLGELMGAWGYTIVQAANGSEAIGCLHNADKPIDLIISDVTMPQMGGIGLLNHLHKQGMATPVILLTGDLDSNDIDGDELAALYRHGLRAVLVKPPSAEQLAETIARVLAQPGDASGPLFQNTP